MKDKRKFSKIFTISFLIGISFVSFAQAAPNAVYVDAVYTDQSSGNYSFGVDAFANIQDGIDAIVSNGTVNIAAGVYDEQVVINGKSLKLKGAGDTTIIRPSGQDKLTSLYVYSDGAPLWPGITVTGIIIVHDTVGSGVTIKDLRVDGINITSLPAGAERLTGILYGESGGTIQNVMVDTIKTSNATDHTYGIDVIASGNPVSVEIINNRISDFLRNGIQATGGSLTVNIRNNIIVGAANPTQTTNGIALNYGLGGRVSGNIINRFHSPLDGWSSSGIILYGNGFKSVVIEDNEVYDADYGISLTGVNDSTIIENYLHDNKTGMMLEAGATNNRIISNTITGNIQGFQIHGRQSSNPTGNKPPGIGNRVSSNFIFENTYGVTSFDDTQDFDARDNWWGSANPDFTEIIFGSVMYIPWWTTRDGVSSSESIFPVPAPSESPAAPVAPEAPRASPSPATPLPAEEADELPEIEKPSPPAGGQAISRVTEVPTQLFDINLEIDDAIISNIKELSARVVFVSFGKVPTPVDLTFIISDETGREVYIEKDDIIVKTEEVKRKKFEGVELSPGKYTLILHTLYNATVFDEFRQSFEITEEEKIPFRQSWIFFLIIILVIIIIYVIYAKIKEKEQNKI